jgi:hypothetical protein
MRPRLTPPFIITMAIFAVLFSIIFAASAQAQGACPNTIACVDFTPPTTYEGGAPIPAVKIAQMTCHIWAALQGSTKRDVAVLPCANRTASLTGLPTGMNCFQVTAQLDGVMSAPSNESCKRIRAPAPTDGAIEDPQP